MLKEYRGFQHIYLRYGYTDLRLGVDGLAALIRQELRLNPFAPNTLYLFCGRRSDRIKCLTYEEDGFLLLYKRVADGSFRWPRTPQEVRDLSYEDFYRLMDGESLEKVSGNSHQKCSEQNLSTDGKCL